MKKINLTNQDLDFNSFLKTSPIEFKINDKPRFIYSPYYKDMKVYAKIFQLFVQYILDSYVDSFPKEFERQLLFSYFLNDHSNDKFRYPVHYKNETLYLLTKLNSPTIMRKITLLYDYYDMADKIEIQTTIGLFSLDSTSESEFTINNSLKTCPVGTMTILDESDEFWENFSREKAILEEENENKISTLTRNSNFQNKFREAVLERDNYQCLICGESLRPLLEAGHIDKHSDASPEKKYNPHNGLTLCCNHHKLYDDNIIIIDENGLIELNLEKINALINKSVEDNLLDLKSAKERFNIKIDSINNGNIPLAMSNIIKNK